MKLSYRWLGEMVDLSETTPEHVQHELTFHTAAVDDCEAWGGGLGDVQTGRVTAVRPHPNADKLRLCTVETDAPDTVEVVCGAQCGRRAGDRLRPGGRHATGRTGRQPHHARAPCDPGRGELRHDLLRA